MNERGRPGVLKCVYSRTCARADIPHSSSLHHSSPLHHFVTSSSISSFFSAQCLLVLASPHLPCLGPHVSPSPSPRVSPSLQPRNSPSRLSVVSAVSVRVSLSHGTQRSVGEAIHQPTANGVGVRAATHDLHTPPLRVNRQLPIRFAAQVDGTRTGVDLHWEVNGRRRITDIK